MSRTTPPARRTLSRGSPLPPCKGLPPVPLTGSSARKGGYAPGPQLRGGPRKPGRARRAAVLLAGADSPLRRMDWVLLATVLALSAVGTMLVWSATDPGGASASDPFLTKNILNLAIGLVLLVAVSFLDYRQIRLLAPVVLAVSCLGLLVVLTPLGSVVNGAKSWISLPGGFQIEPSEYAKLAVIGVTATILGELKAGQSRPGPRKMAVALAVAAIPLVLVVAEPDLGVVMLLLSLVIGLLAVSGLKLRWLAGLVGAGAAVVLAAAQLHLFKAYQVTRLTAFLHPGADPQGAGYSAYQSKIAIGSGGMHGTGLFHGALVAGNFVPEQHTDFIFAVAGEELGLAGEAVIIGLLALLLWRAVRIAAKADDQFGTLLASGIAIWFGVQAFINIGMTLGIMPVTGLPLPFVSYGGSAVFADMIAVGALQAVYRHRRVFARP